MRFRLDPELPSTGNRNASAIVEPYGYGDEAAFDGDRVPTSSRRSSSEPHESMEFESKEEAFNFYKQHATSVGFSAIIKASRRSRISGKFIDAKFVCIRYGTKPVSSVTVNENSELTKKKRGRINRSWLKTDCKARMHVKRRQDGRWIVSSFVGEHNHDLVLESSASKSNSKQPKRKNMSLGLDLHGGNGLSLSSSSSRFHEEDAKVLLEYFSRMQDENPYFFYAIDLNKEQLLRNVFWVDAKGRVDYMNFGDVVLFDTMYKRNGSKFPFVPFIGMNNHFEFILLGYGFLADESKSSYAWLLHAWLTSMHGQPPNVILTDQDHVLEEAVSEVLPDSRHCFCLWHVFSKISDKLGHVIRKHDNFVGKFHKCISKSQTEDQFQKRWWKLVDRFQLRSDQWIDSLHNNRQRWVPVYIKDAVLVGLSTPHHLDSIVSLRKTSLKEFLHQFNIMLQERYEDEAKADLDSWQRKPVVKSPSPYGKQTADIYTHSVFKKFQVEVLGVVACHPKMESKDDTTTTFKVHDFEENQVYRVMWNEEKSDASCGCFMFEYNGFLCRHVMIVLQISGVNSIPTKYILSRWRKDVRSREIESRNGQCNDLYRLALKLGNEGSVCQESYRIALDAVEAAFRECGSINNALHESEELTQGKTKAEEIISGKEKVREGA